MDPDHATYPGWNNSAAPRMNGGFVVGGGNFTFDSLRNWIQRPVLYLCNAAGIFEDPIPLGPIDAEWIGRQAKQTPDGGYVICGEAAVDSIQLDAFVIKTDALGQEEWTRTYGGTGSDFAMAIDNRPGGGYFLGGSYGVSSSNTDYWLLALNDTGGVDWQQQWGTQYHEPSAQLSVDANGDVLIAGAWGTGANWYGRRYLAKRSGVDGSLLWDHRYAEITLGDSYLSVLKEIVPGGDLISAGPNYRYIPGGASYSGVLFRTTNDGDSLWMRYYQYQDSLVDASSGILKDVIPTPDGGFIACGTALAVTQGGTQLYGQDVWVVKTDSMGCIEPGCNLITGMETQITNLRAALHISPNPVAQGGILHLELDLPTSFTPQGELRLTVVNSLGQLVETQPWHGDRQDLAIGQLPPGLYHLHLSDASRWISGGKFVVE